MKQAKLIFSMDRRTVHIEFANGKESLDFESKEEAIHGINECQARGKITKEEAKQFLKEISLADNLPNHNKTISLLPLMLLSALFNSIMEEPEKVVDPYVELCDCGDKRPHAYVYNGNGKQISPLFQFKSDGLVIVEHLLRSERIDEGDSARLNTLINLLKLPEDSILN